MKKKNVEEGSYRGGGSANDKKGQRPREGRKRQIERERQRETKIEIERKRD